MIKGAPRAQGSALCIETKMGSRLRAGVLALLVVLLAAGAGASAAEVAGRREADIRARVRAMTNRGGVQTSSLAQLISVRQAPPPPAPATRPTPATGGWLCVERESYPACAAGVSGLCQPISCAEMVCADNGRGRAGGSGCC